MFPCHLPSLAALRTGLLFIVIAGAAAIAADVPIVAVVPVKKGEIYREVAFDAELRPYKEIELHARATGYLDKMLVDAGDAVKEGQMIAELDVPELKFDLQNAEATERRAKAEMEKATAAYEEAHLALTRLDHFRHAKGGSPTAQVRLDMQRTMQKHAGVFRFADSLKEGVTAILEVAERAKTTQIKDKSKVWNTARTEALELDNLIEVAKATMISAEARKESRGAHVRDDAIDCAETPNGRDDKNWLKHTLWYSEGNRLDYKPVNLQPLSPEVEPIALAKRTY